MDSTKGNTILKRRRTSRDEELVLVKLEDGKFETFVTWRRRLGTGETHSGTYHRTERAALDTFEERSSQGIRK